MFYVNHKTYRLHTNQAIFVAHYTVVPEKSLSSSSFAVYLKKRHVRMSTNQESCKIHINKFHSNLCPMTQKQYIVTR